MAAGVTTDESKAMCVADGTRRPSMRARTPTKLDSFARCRAPHHGPQSPRRSSFSEHEKRRAPSFPSIQGRLRVFSPRAILFAPPGLSPVAPFPSAARPCPCPCPCPCALRNLDFSMDISVYVRVTTRHEAKTPGKHILTTLPKNFGARL